MKSPLLPDFESLSFSKYDFGKAVDYKAITKKIIRFVEKSEFFLLEKLASKVLDIVMEDKKVKKAKVEVDKPGALRYAKSVSVTVTAKR